LTDTDSTTIYIVPLSTPPSSVIPDLHPDSDTPICPLETVVRPCRLRLATQELDNIVTGRDRSKDLGTTGLGLVSIRPKVSMVAESRSFKRLMFTRYPSLLMRILGLRLVPSSPHLTRLVSYEFMNRQLVWGAFTVSAPAMSGHTTNNEQEFLMALIPLLPPVPSLLTPSRLIAPLKAFLTQPTSIDYTQLSNDTTTSAPSARAHAGLLADLPLETCPICHLRQRSAPQGLGSGSTASAIELPPLRPSWTGHDEETQIFVPAQSDCWGKCQWCYYCIASELARHQEEMEEKRKSQPKSTKAGSGEVEEDLGWECLRCGGKVTRAWRVGGEAEGNTKAELEDVPRK
jgi:peroxin-2